MEHIHHLKKRTNGCILIIGIKETTTMEQVMEAESNKQLTRKYNMVHVITYRGYKSILIKNLQESISVFNEVSHIQEIGNEIKSLVKIHQNQITLVILN